VGAPRRIVVGVDGSEDSRRALEWALDLVEDGGAGARGVGDPPEIVAVHALGLLAHLGGGSVVPSAGHRREVEDRLEHEWCRPLAHTRVSHRCLVVEGEPVHAMLSAAHEQAADLLVVGRRGAGGSAGLMIGSTSAQLVHRADCPVVVIPPGPPPA
jgi:nucleotide-binding universal stress UspA family protein